MLNPLAFTNLTNQTLAMADTIEQLSITVQNSRNYLARELADSIISDIKKRTAMGYDAEGNKFTPYSPAYRRKTGKTTVNLRQSGRMLDSLMYLHQGQGRGLITVKPTPHGRINSAQLARFHQTGAGYLPERHFFGWNEATHEQQTWSQLYRLLSTQLSRIL